MPFFRVQFAGSQLWQHGSLLTVMDASNPDHIEQFKKDLHLHEKQKLIFSNDGDHAGTKLVIGYPKTILHPELLDEDILKQIQPLSEETKAVILEKYQAENGLTAKKMDDTENMLVEEEIHQMVTKQMDYGSSGDLQEKTVVDSIHNVAKRHESCSDGAVDIIEESAEKIVFTQSNFSEPSQPKLAETLEQDIEKDEDVIEAQVNDGNLNEVLNVTPEMQTFIEEMKDTTEGLEKEDEGISAKDSLTDKEYSNQKALSFPIQQSDTCRTTEEVSSTPIQQIKSNQTAEVISGLSDDDKPIISAIVEEVSNVSDDTMKQMEYAEKSEERDYSLGEKSVTDDKKHFVESVNYEVDKDVVEELMVKKTYGIPSEMTESFMEGLMTHQTNVSLGKGDAEFTDTSITEKYRDRELQDQLQNYSDDAVEAYASEAIMGAYVRRDMTYDHIPESIDERFPETTYENDMMRGLSDHHFQQDVSYDFQGERLESTKSKEMTLDKGDQEYPSFKDFKEEDFMESRVGQPGWNELAGATDHSNIPTPTCDTFLDSTLVSGSEHNEKHPIPGQPLAEEVYHREIYGTNSEFPKSAESGEDASREKVEIVEVQAGCDVDKSSMNNGGTAKHKNRLAGFISSAIPDSVQSLISSTKSKFDDLLGDDDRKREPDLQFTMKTEEMIGDDGKKYEIHTESYTISTVDHTSRRDFGDTEAFPPSDSGDDNLIESTGTHHSIETTAAKMTPADEKESKKHNDRLFGEKKSTNGLDFELIP